MSRLAASESELRDQSHVLAASQPVGSQVDPSTTEPERHIHRAEVVQVSARDLSATDAANIATDQAADSLRRTVVLATDRPEPELVWGPPTQQDAPSATGPPNRLEEFEDLALSNNPGVMERQSRIDAARGRWVQAGLPPNVVMGYSGQQLFSAGMSEQQGLLVGQEFIRGGKLDLDQAVIAHEVTLAELDWFAYQQRVLTDVRLDFYRVLIDQRRVELNLRRVDVAREAVQAAKDLLAARRVSQVDVMRAEIELKSAEMRLNVANNALQNSWQQLAILVGDPDLPKQTLSGDLDRLAEPLDLESVWSRLIAESPELALANVRAQRARRRIDREFAELSPDLSVEAVVQHDNATQSGNANLIVKMPIPWQNRNQGGIRAARAEFFAESEAVNRVTLGLRHRLNEAFLRYETARQQVLDFTQPDGILASAEETLELVRQGYEARALPYVDLLTAQQTVSQTNLDYLDSLGQFWLSYIEIEGLLLRGSLTEASTN